MARPSRRPAPVTSTVRGAGVAFTDNGAVTNDDQTSVTSALPALIAREIAQAGGWLPFDRFMHLALYAPQLGYYAHGSAKFGALPSSGSDFVTAPELSPLFACALAVQVEDNGPGIKDENRARLFTPNFTTKSSGTGLGLAICKNIIERCGGEIFYSRSFSLKGACFTVRYPKPPTSA